MAYILSLDTSTKVCSVAVHHQGELIGAQTYHLQKSHSNLLPVIIKELVKNCELELKDISAVALAAGPGSYTGLRIGTATVKGLCFALECPMIALDSLESMSAQVRRFAAPEELLCPMIDARRMEVYGRVEDISGNIIWPTAPIIVDESTFDEFSGKPLVMFGNGAEKLKELFAHADQTIRIIEGIHPQAAYMGEAAWIKFSAEQFEDLAYFEPDYLKEYRTNTPSQKFKV
ncbi:tRNA (adenosine(37)-N6)-threonylcarbamoyltransferase complex dimerization subunit type 1 TsaB [Marinoscillum furvescens]|uniref:tRNA threonylcarbamoyladenosine biosynthesis protein TsaB n=1 Tax=Marinoscillum furvescens DSM 4134 TaxID=1122208 RepID=A0A3D9KZ89_MARFU|nr:tRNA (adenosine(37)-N6)-threonylcarbamoyltransferase complex dimerization subunit type 1 TsaB [Marinoscillum furvescens]RED93593.1 tRNA threonylcarbamoyladenosine biosynthesis protein TsaB [Marinoscillum furvescens DSM 4134]